MLEERPLCPTENIASPCRRTSVSATNSARQSFPAEVVLTFRRGWLSEACSCWGSALEDQSGRRTRHHQDQPPSGIFSIDCAMRTVAVVATTRSQIPSGRQGQCGSCYAFSGIVALSMRFRIELARKLGPRGLLQTRPRAPVSGAPWGGGQTAFAGRRSGASEGSDNRAHHALSECGSSFGELATRGRRRRRIGRRQLGTSSRAREADRSGLELAGRRALLPVHRGLQRRPPRCQKQPTVARFIPFRHSTASNPSKF